MFFVENIARYINFAKMFILLSTKRYQTMSHNTPMMQQYAAIKANHSQHILFYRLGDFYEMFFEDAKVAANCLGITLTQRNKNTEHY